MKILQLGKFYPIKGGVEKVMLDLTRGLGERGVQCDMLCAATGESAGKTLEAGPSARIICVPALAKKAATMLSPAMVKYLREHHDYDLIHIHHPDPMAALSLRLSGYRGPVVVHWHSDILKQKALLGLYRPLQNWMLRRASLILGTTPVYVRESGDLARFQDKVSFLPIGIEPMHPDPAGVEALKARWPGKKLIFSLGRFVEYKGFEYLVEAAKYLGEEYHFVMGGDGPLKDSIVSQVEALGLEDRFSFPGRIPDEQLAQWFGACDLFVLSSVQKTEAFAIVQLEAMCCGKPVVSTRIPGSGVSWVNCHGESGLTVEPCNPQALAGAISAVFSSPEKYQELCQGALKRYRELFTKDKMIDDIIKIYTRQIESYKG